MACLNCFPLVLKSQQILAYVEENGKPKSYDTCSGNECRCVVKLLPHIATRDTGNESAEPHRRIEVAVCRPPVSILNGRSRF